MITSRSRNQPYYSKLRKEARTIVASNHFYYAVPVSGINVAVPRDMKSFPTELLPQ